MEYHSIVPQHRGTAVLARVDQPSLMRTKKDQTCAHISVLVRAGGSPLSEQTGRPSTTVYTTVYTRTSTDVHT